MMKRFSPVFIGSSLACPFSSRARHSGSPMAAIIFTRCMSALPRVAVVMVMKSPRCIRAAVSLPG